MTQLAAGQSTTVTVGDEGYIEIATNGGFASIAITPTVDPQINDNIGPLPLRRRYGPFKEGATATINNQTAVLDYDTAPNGIGLSTTQVAAVVANQTRLTAAAFNALVTAGALIPGATYNVAGGQRYALTTTTYESFSGASAAGVAEALTTTTGTFNFTGSAYRFVVDYQSTWYPLLANMPGFQGSRAIVNWAVNSDTPSSPTPWVRFDDTNGTQSTVLDTYNDGTPVYALQNVNPGVTNYGTYVYGYSGYWQGALVTNQPIRGNIPSGTTYTVRIGVKYVSGSTNVNMYTRPLDNNFAPSESNNGTAAGYVLTADAKYHVLSSTFLMDSDLQAFGIRIHPAPAAIQTFNECLVQLEDVSGEKNALIPSEYIPCGPTPTWAWKDTTRGTSRSNPTGVATFSALGTLKATINASLYIGELTDASGTTLTGMSGLFMEPAATNLHQGVNTPISTSSSTAIGGIGQGKISGACNDPTTGAALGVAGVRSGNTTAYIEGASHMMVAASDIALTVTTNVVSSSTTSFTAAGINSQDTYWIWTTAATYGPLTFSSITANSMTSSVALATFASGTVVRIMRVPASGDQILIELNDGTWHATTTSGAVSIPSSGGTYNSAEGKRAVTIPLTAAPSADASYAGSDNGRRLYWYKGTGADFGFTVTGGSATFRVVSDRQQLVTDGLGYISPSGLVFQLDAGGASASFDFGANVSNGAGARLTNVSVFARRPAGASAPTMVLKAHGSPASITGTTSYVRSVWSGTSANNDSRVTFALSSGVKIYVVLMQMEQAGLQGTDDTTNGATATASLSSPILTRGNAANTTRTASRSQRPWGGTLQNNITRRFTWTPSQGVMQQRQVLWGLYQDASNYLELSIANTTVRWRKRRAGTNYDCTATYTPVAGTAVEFLIGISSTTGITMSIGGVAATPNTSDYAGITALTPAAVEDIGGINGGSNGAFGSFASLALA